MANHKRLSAGWKAIILVVLVLFLDQLSKILVKTNMTLGEGIAVFDNWFYIKFIENPGMAFGIDIPGKLGKPLLTLFRLAAVIAIGWYIRILIVKKAKEGLILLIALIMAGAMGNIIDCFFYGLIFDQSTYYSVATFLPENGGYAPLLHGQVVDMLYFPVIRGTYPGWFPWVGGEDFIFFRPIFNIADSSITIGILAIILFQRRYFSGNSPIIEEADSPTESLNLDTGHP